MAGIVVLMPCLIIQGPISRTIWSFENEVRMTHELHLSPVASLSPALGMISGTCEPAAKAKRAASSLEPIGPTRMSALSSKTSFFAFAWATSGLCVVSSLRTTILRPATSMPFSSSAMMRLSPTSLASGT
jgi:hypothetical protein